MQYLFDLFFRIYSLREFISLSLAICYCLISSEENPDQEILNNLDFIRDNTHEKLKIPLSIAELIMLTNYGRNISKSIEFRDNNGVTREFPLWLIIKYSKESYFKLAMHVVKIAKKYSLDIPMRGGAGMIEIPSLPPDFSSVPTHPESPIKLPESIIEIPNHVKLHDVPEVSDLNPEPDKDE